jgi:hypothetical protein
MLLLLTLYTQGYIREILLELMNRRGPKDPFPPGPPPEVAFPTLNAFYIKWTESEKSDFNRTAAAVVAREVYKDWGDLFTANDSEEIFELASAHIKYLIWLNRRRVDPKYIPEEVKRHIRCNADTRMRTVSPFSPLPYLKLQTHSWISCMRTACVLSKVHQRFKNMGGLLRL